MRIQILILFALFSFIIVCNQPSYQLEDLTLRSLSEKEYEEILLLQESGQASFGSIGQGGIYQNLWRKVFSEVIGDGADFNKPTFVSPSNAFQVGQIVHKKLSRPPIATMDEDHGWENEDKTKFIETGGKSFGGMKFDVGEDYEGSVSAILNILKGKITDVEIKMLLQSAEISSITLDSFRVESFKNTALFSDYLKNNTDKIKPAYYNNYKNGNFFVQKVVYAKGLKLNIGTQDSLSTTLKTKLKNIGKMNLEADLIFDLSASSSKNIVLNQDSNNEFVPVVQLWRIDLKH